MRRAGWEVYAGARKDEDLERLRGEGLTPLKLDVTDAGSIASAKAALDERGLHGLVNNAGVAVSGPMEFVPLDELRHQLEVNLVGQVAVTQVTLPKLRAARGWVSVRLPCISFTVRLAIAWIVRLLGSWNVHARISSSIRPGVSFATSAGVRWHRG